MHKKNNSTNQAAKKLTIEDLKQVIGSGGNHLEVEAVQVEDTSGNKGTSSDGTAKAT